MNNQLSNCTSPSLVHVIYPSPIGTLYLAFQEDKLTVLDFAPPKTWETPVHNYFSPSFQSVDQWLTLYFSGKVPDFTPPLALQGTSFQLRVWQLLTSIPYGTTTTYGAIARTLNPSHPPSAQAVGGALNKNYLAIVLPCHRVIGTTGKLVGYGGGLENKRRLLELEGVKVIANTRGQLKAVI